MCMARMKGSEGECIVVTVGLGQRLASPRVWVATEPYPGRWSHHIPLRDCREVDGELLDWVLTPSAGKRTPCGEKITRNYKNPRQSEDSRGLVSVGTA